MASHMKRIVIVLEYSRSLNFNLVDRGNDFRASIVGLSVLSCPFSFNIIFYNITELLHAL